MKKLMVLLFVLAMVNVANAGYVDLQIASVGPSETGTVPIDPVKEILIAPSMWVDIDVVYYPDPGMNIFAISKEMVITGPATITIGGAMVYPGAPGVITWAAGWHTDFSKITMLPSGNPLIDTRANDFGSVAPGIVLDHFLLHCEGPEDVTVVLVENPNTSAGESFESNANIDIFHLGEGPGIIIHQPEPITLALLGLGSLFLARRKK